MKTLAEARRALTVGTLVRVEHHIRPEWSRDATVIRATTQGVYLDHPAAGPDGSYVDLSRRSEWRYNNDGTITWATPDRAYFTLAAR